MLKNIIVYDNNIVNICFKMKAKKDNGQMCAKLAENFRSRGGTIVTVDSKFWGWGGQVSMGWDNPLMGVGPPHPPPYWKTLTSYFILVSPSLHARPHFGTFNKLLGKQNSD